MNRKKLILAILLLLLVVAVVTSFFRMPKQEKAAPKQQPVADAAKPRAVSPGITTAEKSTPAPAKTAAPVAKGPAFEGKVRLDLLERQRPLFTGFRRNIFKPLFAPEAAVSRPAPKIPTGPITSLIPPPPAPKSPGPPVMQAPPPPPLPPPVPMPRPDLARFTFMGFLQKDNQKTIFLSKDKEIFVIKKGDKLAGKYEAANITDEALTIRVLQDGGEIVIPLLENKALIPATK